MSKKKSAKGAKASKGKTPAAKPADPAAMPVPPEPTKVPISAAKGRPMLTWVGKRPLAHVTAFPAQRVERHDALRISGIDQPSVLADDARKQLFEDLRGQCNEECWKDAPFINGLWTPEIGGLLLHGDNKDVLAFLLANGYRGKVNLVYIDPPFDSGADYIRRVALRGTKNGAKLDGEHYSAGEQLQYTDIWANDNYLQFMFERLQLLRELLTPNGCIFLHCDWHKGHHLRCLMDEVFGVDGFRNEIVWQRIYAHSDSTRFGVVHDTILYYTVGDAPVFNKQYRPHTDSYIQSHYSQTDETGRHFRLVPLDAAGPGPARRFGERTIAPPNGRHWAWSQERIDEGLRVGRIVFASTGKPNIKMYLDETEGTVVQSIWDDLEPVNPASRELTEMPTQKPEALLERIVRAASNPGDLLLDCFLGSGTTTAVAQKLGRRWIGCDINKGAIQTAVKRLRGIIAEQMATARRTAADARQGVLFGNGTEGEPLLPKPCAFGFTVWRVNDYDLQIQHNEAVNLACEHIGIERTRSDSYFEGTLGKKLVKIIPFGHPLTPLDLEELRRELDARPDEDRNLTVVCLGMELAAKAWIDDWNRLRKGKNAVNKIDVIELRTDPKYGRFIKHEPAAARVKIARTKRGGKDQIVVEIQDFISPTIVERLREHAGLLSPKIEDWRAMVDCVYIDTAYNGSVLNVALADVPERKADLVTGTYELPAPPGETAVAVKIVDMLGEEILIAATV